jgi:hypothetical protein
LQAVFTHAALSVDAEDGLLASIDQLLEGGIGLRHHSTISVLPAALM